MRIILKNIIFHPEDPPKHAELTELLDFTLVKLIFKIYIYIAKTD